jgi:hypothetical protein
MTVIDASPETIRAVGKAMQLAALLDDRCANVDKARIASWAEQVERHQLTKTDLLDGVQRFYDGPTNRPIQVGDLITHARAVRQDRSDRAAPAAATRAPDSCLFCYGSGYVHTTRGALGDTIGGPAICHHDGRWHIVPESERAEHMRVIDQIRAQARRPGYDHAEPVDITEPRHRQDN